MRTVTRSFAVHLLLSVLLSACAGTGSSAERSPNPNRDLLTQEEIRRHRTVYEAVDALRGTWLRPRGTGSFRNPGQVQVYQDGNRVGGVEVLRSMSPANIAYVRYYDGIAAGSRWGLGHENGVIFVSTTPR